MLHLALGCWIDRVVIITPVAVTMLEDRKEEEKVELVICVVRWCLVWVCAMVCILP